MKRITAVFVVIALMICTAPASAKSGGVVGKYYSTDIRTFLNGAEIDSINIGGQTLISAEDMEYHSFSVYWDGEARTLDIYQTASEDSGPPPAVKKSNTKPGSVLGNYYETDIVTRLDGRPITAYNIGGRTYIHAERMREWGYAVIWSEADRTLTITSPGHGSFVYTVSLSQGSRPDTDASEGDGEGAFAISYENGRLTGRGDAALFDSSLGCDGTEYTIRMSFYQYQGLFYSLKLQELLNGMCYWQYDRKIVEPKEKYAFIDENASIVINGHRAENVKVTKLGGNGHVDFLFEITALPLYQESEIESVYFSAGDTEGMEAYELIFPEN